MKQSEHGKMKKNNLKNTILMFLKTLHKKEINQNNISPKCIKETVYVISSRSLFVDWSVRLTTRLAL